MDKLAPSESWMMVKVSIMKYVYDGESSGRIEALGQTET